MIQRSVVFLHLDLGIGGAERLVVNLALSVLAMEYDVTIVTTHHDSSHCFDETRGDGVLADKIIVVGDWLPRDIFGYGTALCSSMRMVYASLYTIFLIYWTYRFPDAVMVDGVSTPMPLFTLARVPSLFYCHYPDLLLCVPGSRSTFASKLYRCVLDTTEEWTMGCATLILVNSLFTRDAYNKTFPQLSSLHEPIILYPCLEDTCVIHSNTRFHSLPEYLRDSEGKEMKSTRTAVETRAQWSDTPTLQANQKHLFVSLNRFERKKRIDLALESLAVLKKTLSTHHVILVIAGGYDERVAENVDYLIELKEKASFLGLIWTMPDSGKFLNADDKKCDVIFRTSIATIEKDALLAHATALLYTPENEHFGIVPIEAMCSGTPVIAVNSGGPLETILNDKTGYLCTQTASSFANAMQTLLSPPYLISSNCSSIVRSKLSVEMGKRGKVHVLEKFTSTAMKDVLQKCFLELSSRKHESRKHQIVFGFKCFSIAIVLAALILSVCLNFIIESVK